MSGSTILGQTIGYFVVFAGPRGIDTAHVEIPAPGIEHFGQLMAVQHALAQQLLADIRILNWRRLDAPPRIIEHAGPIPANLVS